MIDSHCHIHDRDVYNFAVSRLQFSKKQHQKLKAENRTTDDLRQEIAQTLTPVQLIQNAHQSGVDRMICVGTSHEDSLVAQKFTVEHHDQGIFWSYGIHPDEADAELPDSFFDPTTAKPVAIGEVGLDYRNGTGNRDAQIRLFEQMLQLAQDQNLPLIFHVRDAFDDFFAVIDNFHIKNAVVHSFSDSEQNLKNSLKRDFYIGVNGLATFSNLPTPPLDRTLLETDAPFLTPVPHRGKVNEPAYISAIAHFLAEKHQTTVAEIDHTTTQNAENLFGI